MKTRCSPEGWSKVTTEEEDVLETSLDHHRRDWACEEAMGTNLRAYYVSGLYITQALHPTNTESLW